MMRHRWKATRAIFKSRVRLWRLSARNRAAASNCFYCGVAFEGAGNRQRTVDHRVPRSVGGSGRLRNLVFACRSCNHRKANVAEDVFVASEWLARRRVDVSAARHSTSRTHVRA